jgi:FKBP-type peptidyl-prolyl cis-trans isomerase 2
MEIAQNRAVALDYQVSLKNVITVDAYDEDSPLCYVH